MGLFNFLKPKADPLKELENNPEFARQLLFTEFEYVQKQIGNLRTVGREDDARKITSEYLKKVLSFWLKSPSDPFPIKYLSNCCMMLSVPELGRDVVENLVQKAEVSNMLDLTWLFWELGKLQHQIRDDGARELTYYERAYQASPPKDCLFPAGTRQKAAICHFAHMCAYRINQEDKAERYEKLRNVLTPDVDWSNPQEAIAFIQTASK